jgi:fatty acid desaturase
MREDAILTGSVFVCRYCAQSASFMQACHAARAVYTQSMPDKASKIISVPRNLGLLDRALRAFAALAIALMWWFDIVTGWPAVFLMMMAGALLLNSIMGRCGLYAAFGLSSCPLPAKNDSEKSLR